jgi:hypothetical protein
MSAIYYTTEKKNPGQRSPIKKIGVSTAYLVSELDVVVVDPTSRNDSPVSASDSRVGEQSSHHAA